MAGLGTAHCIRRMGYSPWALGRLGDMLEPSGREQRAVCSGSLVVKLEAAILFKSVRVGVGLEEERGKEG